MSKEETRKKILKSAEELFSKNGYDGTATKSIAKHAGITEMTLFNHFNNKELLYKTVVKERYLAIKIESVFPDLSYDNLEKDLKKIAAHLIENFISNKSLLMMRLKEKESFRNDDTFKMEKDPILGQVIPVFEKYYDKNVLRETGYDSALLFTTTFKGICHLCFLDDTDDKSMKTLVNHFISTFCYGITCKK